MPPPKELALDLELHTLVADIYEAAVDSSRWPVLIDQIADYLSLRQVSDRDSAAATNDPLAEVNTELRFNKSTTNNLQRLDSRVVYQERASALRDVLNLHFDKANQIAQTLNKISNQSSALNHALDHMPIPIIILNGKRQVVAANEKARALQRGKDRLQITEAEVRIDQPGQQSEFRTQVDLCFNNKTSTLLNIGVPGEGNETTLILSSLSISSENHDTFVAVLVASPGQEVALSENSLRTLYGITPAESRLINELVGGSSLKEISQVRHITMNTLRTQLKSVFNKMGVSRQSELMKTVLLGPNRYIDKPRIAKTAEQIQQRQNANLCIPLADGRKLSYAEYGDPAGKPVIGCHPTTGSRFQMHPDEAVLQKLGIRFIVPDRPGFGGSSPLPDRQFADWPDDLAQLLQQLDIETFALFAYCGGTPPALACAAAMPEKVKQVLLTSPVTPYDKIDLLLGIRTPNRILLDLASKLPQSIFHIGRLVAGNLVRNPDKYFDDIISHLCASDAAALNEPEFLDNFKLALAESLSQGPHQFVYEQVLLSQDWKIALENIQCMIHIWHGDQDKHVPIEYSEKFAKDLPNCNFIRKQGYGHFMVYHHWREYMLEVVA